MRDYRARWRFRDPAPLGYDIHQNKLPGINREHQTAELTMCREQRNPNEEAMQVFGLSIPVVSPVALVLEVMEASGGVPRRTVDGRRHQHPNAPRR